MCIIKPRNNELKMFVHTGEIRTAKYLKPLGITKSLYRRRKNAQARKIIFCFTRPVNLLDIKFF